MNKSHGATCSGLSMKCRWTLRPTTMAQNFIGFTIVYPWKQFNWFWYFAVREALRGKGYVQQILTQLIERYKG
ncbi:MAG: hypothetical protein IJ647_08545 [Prevotella sp.]|nr:hypothetical protein [Prevotella sp.]